MKFLKILAAIIFLVGCVALAVYSYTKSEVAIRRLTIEVLRSIPKAFLVMETQREVAVACTDEGSLLLGPRLGHATASRRTHLGVDMEIVKADDVEVTGHQVSVRLPDPEILDTALDYSSVRMFTKRSGFQLLRDLASGRSIERELLEMLNRTIPDYTGEDLRQLRQNFVDRMNRSTGEIFGAKDLEVIFR